MSHACGWTVGSLPRVQCLTFIGIIGKDCQSQRNTWGQHDTLGDGSCIPLQVPVPRGRGLGDASSRDGPEDKDVTQCGSRINIPRDFDQQHDHHDDASSLSFMAETLQQKKPLFSAKSIWVKNWLHCIESWNCFKFFKRKDSKMFRFESYRKPSTFHRCSSVPEIIRVLFLISLYM